MGRQRNEVRVGEVLRVCFVGRDRPQQKTAQRCSGLRARLLFRDDRIFIIDQRIGVGAGSVDQRQALVLRGARPSAAAAASIA